MKKQSNNGRKPPTVPSKKLTRDRVLQGANAIHLSEDEASKLIGRIVEKGMIDNLPSPPSSTPRPSSLPFPVARHRSQGPHWSPYVSQFGDGLDGDDEDDEIDNDPTCYDPIADFAKPIQKKNKTELDFSRWREFVSSDNNVSSSGGVDRDSSVKIGGGKQKINQQAVKTTYQETMDDQPSTKIDVNNVTELNICGALSMPVDTVTESSKLVAMEVDRINESSSKSNISDALRLGHHQSSKFEDSDAAFSSDAVRHTSLDESQQKKLLYNEMKIGMDEFSKLGMLGARDSKDFGTLGCNSMGCLHGEKSVENEIDAENRALLLKMSPEEIAEAQAEISSRVNPEMLKVLKKRGLKKLEKQRSSICASGSAGVVASGDTEVGKLVAKSVKDSLVSKSNLSASNVDLNLKDIEKRTGDGVVKNLISEGGSLWDVWSKRVEAVRTLRFSLDGNVIEGSSLGQTYNADNVAERDFLRTEGDPGAAGYTIKEALALTRSIIPGQRALALHLLASVLCKALQNICSSQLDSIMRACEKKNVDWEAIWAYVLGPEPDLVLSLRMALDDNHNSVVLASARVIQCVLACDSNENFFNRLEKMGAKDFYTAPVFRRRPDIRHGFLGGGFWKYSTKPSNILPLDEGILDGKGEEHTIQDDNVVAGQDVVGGLVRMGILPRFCYILETDPAVGLEECILSILVGIARHSPTCADAIWKCKRLVQTIIDRFTLEDNLELQVCKFRSVTLLRVLAQSSNTICTEFIKKGYFQIVTWKLYRVTSSIDEWVKCGRENCKVASELMVEQLRFWKVCITYGHCISYFPAFFPALCLWLNPPSFDKLLETNVFFEFAAVSEEIYLVLETLVRRLPDVYSLGNANQEVPGSNGDNLETWCWSDVGPMVDTGLMWIELLGDSTLSKFVNLQNGVKIKFIHDSTYVSALLLIMSAAVHMLHAVLAKAIPVNVPESEGEGKKGPILPDLVANLVLQIIKKFVLNLSDPIKDEHAIEQSRISCFIEKLCDIRLQSDHEASLASVRCLHGFFRIIVSIDCLIQLIGDKVRHTCFQGYEPKGKIFEDGILKCSLTEWRRVISVFIKLVASECHFVQNIEVFGRGGPAPGVGVGWGAFGGGFWSLVASFAQADASLLSELLENFHCAPTIDLPGMAEENFMTRSINSALAVSLVAGPGDKMTIEKALNVLLQIPVLKYLDQCILHFLHRYHRKDLFKWEYEEGDLIRFRKLLFSHFRIRWLSVKKKKKKPELKDDSGSTYRTVGNFLETIHEDVEASPVTVEDSRPLTVEWAHQRLPLPSYWLLSPITTISDVTPSDMPNTMVGVTTEELSMEFIEVAKAGLFFLLGIEALSSNISEEDNPRVWSIPLTWKLHSLSVALLAGMGILEDERSRGVFEALQFLYGQLLDELQFSSPKVAAHKVKTLTKEDELRGECLMFQSEIHESYSTFIETLVEQFAAISYGDPAYGRQIAIYLLRQTEVSVRLSAWNALSNARVLELLPPLDSCLSKAEGYLEPAEDNECILEAYMRSWSSGSLDRAANRGSGTYTIVVHHLSSFVFKNYVGERLLLRNKMVKLLLRDYSRKQQHEAMMLDLIQYNSKTCYATQKPGQNATTSSLFQMDCINDRFKLLKEACEGNSQLLTVVEKLKSSISKEQSNAT